MAPCQSRPLCGASSLLPPSRGNCLGGFDKNKNVVSLMKDEVSELLMKQHMKCQSWVICFDSPMLKGPWGGRKRDARDVSAPGACLFLEKAGGVRFDFSITC